MDNQLPSAVETERALLGAVLLDSRLFFEANERLREIDFSLDSHRRIYKRMESLAMAKRPIDIISLVEELKRNKEVEAVGGIAYLASLTEGLPRRLSIAEYVRVVKDKSLGRQIIGIAQRVQTRACDQAEDQSLVLAECIRDFEDALLDSPEIQDLQSIGQYVVSDDPMAKREPGIMTGFKDYDALTAGLHAEELTIVAARTSVGKTSYAGSLGMNLAASGKPVAIFLNEQSKRSFFFRLVSRKSSVPLERIKKDDLSDTDRYYIKEAIGEIKMLPMFWESGSHITIPQIRAKCARLMRGEDDIAAIIIDQLNHLPAEGVVRKGEKLRSDEIVGRKVMAVKDIAKDLHRPVVLMHQLNRDAVKKGGRPSLEHLKGSGECEEHADNVVLLHRPEDDTENAELIVAKARDGATGICSMRFKKECCSWGDR